MINFKKAFAGIIVGLSLLAGAAGVDAACTTSSGKVAQIFTVIYDLTGNGSAYTLVYIAPPVDFPSGPQGFWYVGFTLNDKAAGTLTSAQSGSNTVRVTGNAASCPASGTFRSIGLITEVDSADSF